MSAIAIEAFLALALRLLASDGLKGLANRERDTDGTTPRRVIA